VRNGTYQDSTSGPGDKSVSGSTGWTDYTLQGDVQLNAAGQAGLIFRVTNPSTGADSFNGYFIGLQSSNGTFFLGRENGAWTHLYNTTIPGGVALNTWYHVTVQAVGCTFTASAQQVGSSSLAATFSYTDSSCTFTSGQVGVRDHYTTASWRNVAVTPLGTTTTTVAPYYAPFASGSSAGWSAHGGTWSVSSNNETYSDTSGGSGDKAVTGSTTLVNYTLQGDLKLTSEGANANAGLIVHVTHPATGIDSFDGYYAGITSSGTLILGREAYNWTKLTQATLASGVSLNTWYHMSVQVSGCTLTVAVQPINSPEQAVVRYTDTGCSYTSGQIGVRTFNADASWRYIEMTPLP